jgi:hypothetical protein
VGSGEETKNHTCPRLHRTPLLPRSLAVTGSSLLLLDLYLESEASQAVSSPAMMPAAARTHPPSSFYLSCFLLCPAPRNPPTMAVPSSQRASTMDPPASRREVVELRVTPPRPRAVRTTFGPASFAPPQTPCAAADLRASVDLRNDEPPFVRATN